MINSIADIQALILSGNEDWKQYGEVNAVYHKNFVLFNYTQMAQFQKRWNWFERNSRGLIFDAITAECVARPFSKFFNYGEALPEDGALILEISEKMDGSLGILYRDKGMFRIATRGSFTSDQAVWATREVGGLLTSLVPDNLTLLFEIIYPANRVVVDYGSYAGLVLIGAIDRFTGRELYASHLDDIAARFSFQRPKTYDFTDVRDILAAAEQISANEEGWVLRYDNGERYKIKGAAYRLAHRIMTGASFNRVLDAVEQDRFNEMIEGVPDEFLAQVKLWKAEIESVVAGIESQCLEALAIAPQNTQKEFALWVQANYPKVFHSYLFAAKAGKPVAPIAYRNAFANRKDADRTLAIDEA